MILVIHEDSAFPLYTSRSLLVHEYTTNLIHLLFVVFILLEILLDSQDVHSIFRHSRLNLCHLLLVKELVCLNVTLVLTNIPFGFF